MGDMAGLDIGWEIRKRRYVERPNFKYSKVADKIAERGRFGQKTGKGWYLYEPGSRKPIPDPEVEHIIADYRKETGVKTRQISDDEIVERLIYALVNEGAYILEEGIALRASDIDMVYLTGYGFPAVSRRADVLRRYRRLAQGALSDREIPARIHGRGLEARAAARKARQGRQEVQRIGERAMTEAVIVSTARTPLCKSWRGALNMTHGAKMGGTWCMRPSSARRWSRRKSRTSSWDARRPRARPAATSRARSRSAPGCRPRCRA
jgi:hypothetical protein